MHAHSDLDSRSLSLAQPQLLTSGRNAIRDLAMHVVAALGRWWRARAERRRRLRAMAQLEAMSDRALKDIGVHRSEIYSVVNHGRYAPPAYILRKGRQLPNPMSARPHTTYQL